MEEIFSTSTAITKVLMGGIGILFFVGLVVNFAQAQLAGGTGDPIGYARAVQQGIAMVVILAIAANAEAIGSIITGLASPATGGGTAAASSSAWLSTAWRGIARIVVSTVLGGVIVFTTVAVVSSGVGGMASSTLGSAQGVSSAFMKTGVLIVGGLVAIGSIFIANGILDKIF
jgi:hypothetical protein